MDLTVDAVAQQKNTYFAAWGEPLPYKPRVILFATTYDFQEWRGGFGGDAVIGQTSDDWGATVQVITDEDSFDLAYGTVLHEIGHLYQFLMCPMVFQPDHGLLRATLRFLKFRSNMTMKTGYVLWYERATSPFYCKGMGHCHLSKGQTELGAWGMILAIPFLNVSGKLWYGSHRQLMQELGVGIPRNEALEKVTGLTIVQMETEWREWLGADGPAPTLIPTQAYQFPPTVTPFQFPTASQ